MSSEFLVVLTTVDKLDSAHSIAKILVNEKAAACVQVEGPLTSFYQWDGKIEDTIEYRLVIKTTAAKEMLVYDKVRQNHPYEVPQILSIPVTGGDKEYLDWVVSMVAGGP